MKKTLQHIETLTVGIPFAWGGPMALEYDRDPDGNVSRIRPGLFVTKLEINGRPYIEHIETIWSASSFQRLMDLKHG